METSGQALFDKLNLSLMYKSSNTSSSLTTCSSGNALSCVNERENSSSLIRLKESNDSPTGS